MRKNEKIIIGILAFILVVMVGILVFTKTEVKKVGDTNIDNQSGKPVEVNKDDIPKDLERIINVNGILYYDTGRFCEDMPRCGTLDGNITKIVSNTEIPTEDGQANFEGVRGYQYGAENTIEVPTDEGWRIFEAKVYSFCGVIKQIEENLFFVEPDEGEEIRKSADLIMVGKIKNDNNLSFEVGEKVKVTYDGYVMETYPAQIKAIKYEKVENNL